jgi:N-acetylmuramoyl-L-alanine amidase
MKVFLPFAILILAAAWAYAGESGRQMLDAGTFASMLNAAPPAPDQSSGRYTTEVFGVKVVLAPGMAVALAGNEAVELSARVEFDNGRLLVPASAVSLINSACYRQRPASVPITPPPDEVKPKNFTVALDPGHVGGPNEGGHGCGLAEYKLTFDIANKTAEELKKRGFSVLITRSSLANLNLTYDEDLENRPALANTAGADIFVSIHTNETDNPDAEGLEIFYAPLKSASELADRLSEYDIPARFLKAGAQPADGREKTAAWKKILSRKDAGSLKLAEKLLSVVVRGTGDVNRGVKTSQLRVTTLTFCPSALIELGFLTHEPTAEKLAKGDYRLKLANLLADGIEEYWKETCGE